MSHSIVNRGQLEISHLLDITIRAMRTGSEQEAKTMWMYIVHCTMYSTASKGDVDYLDYQLPTLDYL